MINKEEWLGVSERPGMKLQQNFTSECVENLSMKIALTMRFPSEISYFVTVAFQYCRNENFQTCKLLSPTFLSLPPLLSPFSLLNNLGLYPPILG